MTTPDQFQIWLHRPEGSRIEFKAATGSYHFDKLVKYCVALANERGGQMLLGVSDKRPRKVLGTQVFPEPGRTEASLFEKLHRRIQIEEYTHEGKRVLIVHVPARLPGTAWQYKGSYWMRAGDSLVPMTDEQLRLIHAEIGSDYSAEPCPRATMEDLNPAAIDLLRILWQRKSSSQDIAGRSMEGLLADSELVVDGRPTYAALILLGTHKATRRFLSQAELIFEYRSNDAPGPAADRVEHSQGFLPILDTLWQRISLRNDLQHFQQGLFVWDVPTLNERAVRETVLNAVSHRDYTNTASIFVRQFPRRIEIVSPGGFLPGVTIENLLWQQKPRNRRIADVLAKCGLVERAGQGFDLIYRECIQQSKPLPDFSHTDSHSVWVTLHGEIEDPDFLRFLEEIGPERASLFSTEDFLVLDFVRRDLRVPDNLKSRLRRLVEDGIVESVGRGRGVRYLLSRRFYHFLGKAGIYTRKRGLDRETNKALLLKHISDYRTEGASLADLQQVLPSVRKSAIQWMLGELRSQGAVRLVGKTKGARWYPSESTRQSAQ